jgi:biopolymer transport protein ExbD
MSFGSFGDQDDAPMAEINVTPLVDVMLVLLIVFMVTMPVLTHSIPLQLPQTNTENQAEPAKPMRLSIDAEGKYFLGDKEVALSALETEFKAVAKQSPDTVIAIASDEAAPYKFVAQALSSAQEAGLSKVGFVTEAEH